MNLDDEIICDFNVTKFRKKIWYEELEMLKQFISICEKYRLKYFVCGGTLLGAIRHNGYIPWDDDIDIMMPRKDYEEFLQVAKEELPAHLFLQSRLTESKYMNGHAQIRNSKTTCFIRNSYADLKNNKNCGIFIDIFPYDYVYDDYKKRQKQAKRIKRLKGIVYNSYQDTGKKIKRIISKIIVGIFSADFLTKKIDKLAQKVKDSKTVALITFLPGYERNVWDVAWFEKLIPHKFEDIIVNIPLNYDEVLTIEYGDYMTIPKEKGGSIHGTCFFDFERSYLEYKNISKNDFDDLFKKINY